MRVGVGFTADTFGLKKCGNYDYQPQFAHCLSSALTAPGSALCEAFPHLFGL